MSSKNTKKKIVFLTGTRADFGKIKPLISIIAGSNFFEPHIFVTGMHMSAKYGNTVNEIINCGFPNIYKYSNGAESGLADLILSNTISGFSNYVKTINPEMIIVHGDRVEALAGALVGSINNILVAHIEGGEVSGTIDEHIRHSISKVSHLHFVANKDARRRLIQMGEDRNSIFVIGSPDLDVMMSKNLPDIQSAKSTFEIPFSEFAILMYHPVTTGVHNLSEHTNCLVDALIESNLNYVVIHPNNDLGTDIIYDVYRQKLSHNDRFKIFPSIRFEHFLTFIKNSRFIIGNSSAGIREAPFYGIPSINIGDRQRNRWGKRSIPSLFHCKYDKKQILRTIRAVCGQKRKYDQVKRFGSGDSSAKFIKIVQNKKFWQTEIQKQFFDLDLI